MFDPYYETSVRGKTPRTKLGGKVTLTLIPGVGVGPEICKALVDVFQCSGAPIDFDHIPNAGSNDKDFYHMIHSIERNGIAIKGNIETRERYAIGDCIISKNMLVRRMLDLYLNLIECKPFPGTEECRRLPIDFDITVIRQNTEGEYALIEHQPLPDMVENLKIVTRFNCHRLVKYAFEYAVSRKRKRVTCVHSCHIMPMSEGLLVNTFHDVSREYPEISTDSLTPHQTIKEFNRRPDSLDVVVTTSLSGGTLVACLIGFIGSAGLIAGTNLGERYKVYEPAARNKGISIAGKGLANPTAFLMCGVSALKDLGYYTHANIIESAVRKTIRDDKVWTLDLGGKATTQDFIDNVVGRMRSMTENVHCVYDPPPVVPKIPSEPTAPFVYPETI